MRATSLQNSAEIQREFFLQGATLTLDFRIKQLKKLKNIIEKNEKNILNALYQDLHKAPQETYVNEIALVLREINYHLKHLKKWLRPKKVGTPFPLLWPGKSYIHYEPYGCVLIIAPWNYPFLLSLLPLIGAISAGNCITLKPSELAPHTAELLAQLLGDLAPQINVIQGDAEVAQQLLAQRWDYIFFTGSTKIAIKIAKAASRYLTPYTIEAGGKSPCIVDATANFAYAARRIVWAKFTNAGQTCIAPDYVLVEKSCKKEFIQYLKDTIVDFYGKNAQNSQSYGRIINQLHFTRLCQFLDKNHIIFGGEINQDELFISPTLLDNVDFTHPIMQEEIFGPLLPILSYENLSELILPLKKQPKPLALYLFSQQQKDIQKILKHISFGGGCINDCLLHLVNANLPFGGVGNSGIGRYHGWYSFETFSHAKAIYQKNFTIDFKLEYPPYQQNKWRWLRYLFGWSKA